VIRMLTLHSESHSQNPSQDMWWLSGITRDVVLYSKPMDAYISDYTVKHTLLTGSSSNFSVEACVSIASGMGLPWPEGSEVNCSIVGPFMMRQGRRLVPDTDSAPRGSGSAGMTVLTIALETRPDPLSGSGWVAEGRAVVEGVRMWTADEPWLYTAVVSLRDRGGKCVDCEACRVGFRDVRIKGRELLLNGAPIEVLVFHLHHLQEPSRASQRKQNRIFVPKFLYFSP
jgi:beta-galactosidase